MNKALFKITIKEIAHSLGRFISILLIVALGVAFYAGISSSSGVMKHTADKYYDDYNLMDIKILSSGGISYQDVEDFKKVKGISGVYAAFTLDTITYEGTNEQVTKVLTFPLNKERSDPNYINQIRVIEGRLPKNNNECVLEKQTIDAKNSHYKIGDDITLYSGNNDKLDKYLKNDKYKVVGYVNTPYYLSYEKGSSSIGDGSVDDYIIISDQNVKVDYYSEVYLSVKGVKKYNSYTSDEYTSKVKKVTKELKKITSKRESYAYQSANEKLLEAKDQYNSNKKSFDQQISDAQNVIDTNRQQLDNSIVEYNNGLSTYDATINDLVSRKTALENQLAGDQANIDSINYTINNTTLSPTDLANYQNQLQFLAIEVNEINRNIEYVDASINTANTNLESAKVNIENGKAQIQAAEDELAIKKSDGEKKLAEAKSKLDESEKHVKQLKDSSWYVLNRNSFYSFVDYGSAADRMAAIAKVFPVFFFLVAALVCLTCMTRMVDEGREEIGTLKALGYSKAKIGFKYIFYCLLASLLGGVIGSIIGMIVFPSVIFNAWAIMYSLIPVQLYYDWPVAISAIVICTLITLITTIIALYAELVEVPASLMRPKAPKNGKAILLERIKPLWNHMSFTSKVTARNIFRYKKRFLMTVIGICGCSALLVAGQGIRDSINDIAYKQYGEIYKFDMSIEYSKDIDDNQRQELLQKVVKTKNVENASDVAIYNGSYADTGEDKAISLYVVSKYEDIMDFISFHSRENGEEYKINNDGVIITEKIANDKHLKVNDYFEINNGDGVIKKVKIAHIMENYIGHAVYMSDDYYEKTFKQKSKPTTIFAVLKNNSEKSEEVTGTKLMSYEGISSVTYYSGLLDNFQDTIASLNTIVYVLIFSAGLLAIVVLYNLSTVNIAERIREIATIKVLGFTDLEVSAYIYRESLILSFIGALVGLVVGVFLHGLIMDLAELDTVMFGRNIDLISFVIAVVITMVFSLIVNYVMYFKLKKVKMVESLKSVE